MVFEINNLSVFERYDCFSILPWDLYLFDRKYGSRALNNNDTTHVSFENVSLELYAATNYQRGIDRPEKGGARSSDCLKIQENYSHRVERDFTVFCEPYKSIVLHAARQSTIGL